MVWIFFRIATNGVGKPFFLVLFILFFSFFFWWGGVLKQQLFGPNFPLQCIKNQTTQKSANCVNSENYHFVYRIPRHQQHCKVIGYILYPGQKRNELRNVINTFGMHIGD